MVHNAPSGTYKVFHGPGGEIARSTIEAWRKHEQQQQAELERASAASRKARPLPPGWSARLVNAPSKTYKVFHGPGGEIARSMIEAWRKHGQQEAWRKPEPEGGGSSTDQHDKHEKDWPQEDDEEDDVEDDEEDGGEEAEEVLSLVAVEIDPREANPGVDHRCCICLEDCLDGTQDAAQDASQSAESWGRATCCQAKFHHQCLVQWLQQSEYANLCPSCRCKVKSTSSRRLLSAE